MFGLGFWEVILLLLVALLVLGPKKLPDLLRVMGKATREFRRAAEEFQLGLEDVKLDSHPPHGTLSRSDFKEVTKPSVVLTQTPVESTAQPITPTPRRIQAMPHRDAMTLVEHLTELRRRLFYCFVALVAVAFVGFSFAADIFTWLCGPLATIPNHELVVLTPMEMFFTYMKLAFVAAIFGSTPFWLWQLWLFISPGLYKHEKRWIIPFVVLGTLFFIGGGAFSFYVVLPLGFKYLVAMLPETVHATYSAAAYTSLTLQMMLAFGVVFELPLVMWILSAAGIVALPTWKKIRPYWIVIGSTIAAILTPPDPLTMVLMAIPLILFYEVGILGARLLQRSPTNETT